MFRAWSCLDERTSIGLAPVEPWIVKKELCVATDPTDLVTFKALQSKEIRMRVV